MPLTLRFPLQAGYTLVEMMVVVVIVGVLATLAVYGVRKYIYAAKTHEATWVIKDIKEGQESFKRETHTYLNVSGDLDTLYPNAVPGKQKTQWGGGTGPVPENWRTLQVSYNEPVQFGYACVAGGAGGTVPQPMSKAIDWPSPAAPWYVVRAVGNLDDDDKQSVFVGSSFTSEIWTENEGE
jgi:type IV pilus assembly protein PilA